MDEHEEQLFLKPVVLDKHPESPPQKYILAKWLIMPFASIIGALIGSIAVTLILWVVLFISRIPIEGNGFPQLYIVPFVSGYIFGFLWVYIADSIAPKGKKITATIMGSILCTLIIISVAMIFLRLEVPIRDMIIISTVSIAILVSSIHSIINSNSDDSKRFI